MIKVCGPRDPRNNDAINTTSRSKSWSRGLSPFFLGPVRLYGHFVAQNVENAWQFSKVYTEHLDEIGEPGTEYWNWATTGWNQKRAVRYPMGKGSIPLYSYWNGEKLPYVEARKKIYIPLYAGAVRGTDAYAQLEAAAGQKRNAGEDLWLWDFDGYDYHKLGLSLDQVVEKSDAKMGHAFVLAMMLEGKV